VIGSTVEMGKTIGSQSV